MTDLPPARPSGEAILPEGFDGRAGSPPAPRFCGVCGGPLDLRSLPDEEVPRLVCRTCGRIHYRNPIVVASAVIEHNGRTLLLQRARPPRAGAWVFPGGFVELGETVEQAAIRECREEIGVPVRLGPLLGVYSRPGPGVVVVVYRAAITDGEPSPGPEATALAWFPATEIPWGDLAFDTTAAALRDWTRGQR